MESHITPLLRSITMRLMLMKRGGGGPNRTGLRTTHTRTLHTSPPFSALSGRNDRVRSVTRFAFAPSMIHVGAPLFLDACPIRVASVGTTKRTKGMKLHTVPGERVRKEEVVGCVSDNCYGKSGGVKREIRPFYINAPAWIKALNVSCVLSPVHFLVSTMHDSIRAQIIC